MNILLVTEPGVNGVFRYVEALSHFLLSRGVRVHLAYSDVRGSDRLPLLVRRIEAAGGRTLNLRVDSRPALRDLPALYRLWKFTRQIRPDLIHSHSSKAGALARLLGYAGLDCPQLYHAHAYRGMQPEAGRLVGIFNLAETVLGQVGATISCSEDERAFATGRLGLAPERCFLIPNAVDCARFHPVGEERKKTLREQFKLPLDAPVLGAVCRSSVQKDPFTLYKAFALALPECPDAWLFHVGEGELDPQLETLLDELGVRARVVRLPYLPNTAEAYQAADGFILTSRYEGFSLAALEALATNLPVILSEAPGTGDLIRLPLSHRWNARPGNVAGFVEVIRSWYRDLAARRPINHVEIIRESFDSAVTFGRVSGLYEAQIAAARTETPVLTRLWSQALLAVGGLGIVAALFLSLKRSGDVPFTRFTPDWLTLWVNHHGVMRNFSAYAALALPFLLREARFPGRVRTALLLAALAIGLECAQLFIPTRWFDLRDIATSVAGIGVVWAVLETVRRRQAPARESFRHPPHPATLRATEAVRTPN